MGGDLLDDKGEMTVVSQKGQVTAHISYENKEYEIYPVEDDVHVMVELADSEEEEGSESCIALNPSEYEGSVTIDDELENGRVVACNDRTVRVLVLYTSRAAQMTNNVQGVAQLAVSQFNQAQSNSQVNGSFRLVLANIAEYGLTESGNMNDDLEVLANSGNTRGAFVESTRRAAGADLVVLFTHGNYGSIYGNAYLGPDPDLAYSIVQITSATSGIYTFAHEIGHLYGTNHQTCGDHGVAGCAVYQTGGYNYGYSWIKKNGFLKKRDRYLTAMHSIRSNYDHILHFSNPDVIYSGKVTGSSTRDNARVIEENDATVAGFNNTPTLSASIDGPTQLDLFYQSYTWEAVVSCGNPVLSYGYRWEYSFDGFNYSSGGTRDKFVSAFYPGQSSYDRLYLRLLVVSGGQFTYAYRTVSLPRTDFDLRPGIQGNDSLAWEQIVEIDELNGITLEDAYPNPVANETHIGFSLPEQQAVYLDVLDLNGKLVKKVVRGEFSQGYHEVVVDRRSITAGLYVYQLVAGETKLTKRLIIGE